MTSPGPWKLEYVPMRDVYENTKGDDMTTKFTPGPWKFAKTCVGIPAIFPADGTNKAIALLGVRQDFDTAELPNMEANSRLIASAPELLEAAKMLLAYIETGDMRPLDLRIARAAIAKATGQEPT